MLMGRMMIDHWILGVPYFFHIPRCRLFAHIWTVLLFVALSRSVPHLKFAVASLVLLVYMLMFINPSCGCETVTSSLAPYLVWKCREYGYPIAPFTASSRESPIFPGVADGWNDEASRLEAAWGEIFWVHKLRPQNYPLVSTYQKLLKITMFNG